MVKDATGSSDALRKFKTSEALFQRPVVVDWNNGRAGELVHEAALSGKDMERLAAREFSRVA